MIHVDCNEVQLGISKRMNDSIPLFDAFYGHSPEACIKATLTTDLHALFIGLMHKFGATKAIDMIELALVDIVEDYESSKIINLNKENKDHD